MVGISKALFRPIKKYVIFTVNNDVRFLIVTLPELFFINGVSIFYFLIIL